MPAHIVIIQGHPDPSEEHFCHALAESYEAGAKQAGHEVRQISVARLDFPLPETPVITTSLNLGSFTSIFFRLCSLAPFISISSEYI